MSFSLWGDCGVYVGNVGEERIWESLFEKLLEVTVDKELKFNEHLNHVNKKLVIWLLLLDGFLGSCRFKNAVFYLRHS